MPPDDEILAVRLLLRSFAIRRDRWIAALCHDMDVSRTDYDALEALDENGPLTPGELGTLLSLTSGSVTALIDRLERLDWATREQHPDDRRKVVVKLTMTAWQLGQNELRPYLNAVDAATRNLTKDQRRIVSAFLGRLVENVDKAPRAE